LNDKQRSRWRNHALAWLRADLALLTKQLQTGKPRDRQEGQAELLHWKRNPDLVGVRDKAAVAKLPAADQQAWLSFWAELAATRKRAVSR
jgi:hypothetical protein